MATSHANHTNANSNANAKNLGENAVRNTGLPDFFKPILWSYDFDEMHAETQKKTILVQTINYGQWKHWHWIAQRYGKSEIAKILSTCPQTAFRPPAFFLAKTLFHF